MRTANARTALCNHLALADNRQLTLDRMGRPWRLSCVSESMGGLQAAVFSGSAISVVASSALVPGMRVIGRAESFPDLPQVDLVLHRAPGPGSAPSNALANFVIRILKSSRTSVSFRAGSRCLKQSRYTPPE